MSTATTAPDIRGFYRTPGAMTMAGRHAEALRRLPDDMEALVRIVQGLVIHQFVAKPFYGVELDEARGAEAHIRPVSDMLDRILELDSGPLTTARAPERRLVGVCRHFVVLLLAILRAKGLPARCRAGFGAYFNPGTFEDHVVCEYWDPRAAQWRLADPQFDEVWRRELHISHDILAVPRDRFLVAGDAWLLCRNGEADAATFGIAEGNRRGLWFVASNVVREVAELNKMELLQWDTWGAMPKPDEPMDDQGLALFDEVGGMVRQPDASFDQLRRRYESDHRLRVPPAVFNALRNGEEPVGERVSAAAD